MAYERQTFVNDSTILTAEMLNHIEDGIIQNEKTIQQAKDDILIQVIESLGGNPVFGYVDKNNNIIVSGVLADGTYTVKYEMEDGSTLDVGDLVLDSNVYYSVTNNLTNCTNGNSLTEAIGGNSYSAVISANSGYELSSVVVTMGGVDISDSVVSDGSISITSVTGNIVITAVATTNFIEYNSTNTTDWSIWINNARIGSDGTYREDTSVSGGPAVVSNYIAVQNGDIVEFEGFYTTPKSSVVYNAEKAVLTTGAGTLTSLTTYLADITEGLAGTYAGQFTINNASVAYVRIGGYIDPGSFPMSIKIKRNGEYL